MTSRVLEHGNWKFDYDMKKNIFDVNGSIFDSLYFTHTKNPVVMTYDDANANTQTEDVGVDTEAVLEDYRRAAMIHKIVRNMIKPKLINGAKIKDIVETTENLILQLFKQDRDEYFNKPSECGLAFPVGVSVNNVIAHDSALLIDDRYLETGDIVKFDFGTHQNGHIIDSAFTYVVGEEEGDSIYYPLIEASREATYSAIGLSGPDARLVDISEYVSEIICSHEIELDGGNASDADDGNDGNTVSSHDNIPIVPVDGIGGHDILPYRVHGEKLIFSTPNRKVQEGQIMKEGEIYAIETYASTGYGNMTQEESLDMCTHFMVNHGMNLKKFYKKNPVAKSIKNRNGLPFTLSWIDRDVEKFNRNFKKAVQGYDIIAYPPLMDIQNSRVSQFEHTIRVGDGSVEIFSKGEDY